MSSFSGFGFGYCHGCGIRLYTERNSNIEDFGARTGMMEMKKGNGGLRTKIPSNARFGNNFPRFEGTVEWMVPRITEFGKLSVQSLVLLLGWITRYEVPSSCTSL